MHSQFSSSLLQVNKVSSSFIPTTRHLLPKSNPIGWYSIHPYQSHAFLFSFKKAPPDVRFSPLTQPSATIPFTPFIPIHKKRTHKEQNTGIEKRRTWKTRTIDILSRTLTNAHIGWRITLSRRKQLVRVALGYLVRISDEGPWPDRSTNSSHGCGAKWGQGPVISLIWVLTQATWTPKGLAGRAFGNLWNRSPWNYL